MGLLLVVVGSLAALVGLSLALEALRARPEAPRSLYWDPAIPSGTRSIPGARLETVPGGGHFLSLDQPDRLAGLIGGFA